MISTMACYGRQGTFKFGFKISRYCKYRANNKKTKLINDRRNDYGKGICI